MNWQQVVSLLIVATAGGLFLRSHLLRRKLSLVRNLPCGGCPGQSSRRPQHTIIYRAKKGERPQIILKQK